MNAASAELSEIIEPVVEATYGALFQPDLWTDVIERFRGLVDCPQAALHSAPQAGEYGSIFITQGLDPTPILPVIHIYGRQAPFMDRAMALGILPGVFLHQDVIPYEELHATDYYRHYMHPMNVEHGMTAVLRASLGNERAPIALAVGRERSQAPFGEREAAIARALFPHFRRAVQLRLEIEPARMLDAAIGGTLDGFETACCLLGYGGKLLHANAAARHLFSEGDRVEGRCNELRAIPSAADRALGLAIQKVCDPTALWSLRSPAEILIATEEAGPLVAVVIPLGHDNPFLSVGPIRGAVYLLDARNRPADSGRLERLRNLFALTPAESEVASQLMSGLSVAEIADKRGASVLTVRTQLRSILEKTQSSRQADLFKLNGLLNGPSSKASPRKG